MLECNQKVGIPSWTYVSAPTDTVTLNGLLELTKYEMEVANICGSTPGSYTLPYYFTTPTVIYCPMSSGSSANEFISKVNVKPNGKPWIILPMLRCIQTLQELRQRS